MNRNMKSVFVLISFVSMFSRAVAQQPSDSDILSLMNARHIPGAAALVISSGYSRGEKISTKGVQPQSEPASVDTCQRWHGWLSVKPTSQQEARRQYDTLRRYIASCGKNNDSYDAFNGLSGAAQFMSDDPTRFDIFRNWLISVLYLNTTSPYYFCACMESIAGTYQYGKYHPLATLAILKYIDSNGCSSKGNRDQIVTDSSIDFQEGYDPTHLPSLDSLGLGFLLQKNGVPSESGALPSIYLTSFASNPNPFKNEIALDFTLNRMSYVTLAIYDELGRSVWGDGRGSSLEAGRHTVHIEGRSLPSGSLYARIATGFGEVKTVKLVHEK